MDKSSKILPQSSTGQASDRSSRVKNILYLERNHVDFEAPSQKESVFFDECNKEIISLTCGIQGKTRVIFQSTERNEKIQFLLPVDKKILSIKLNPSRTILGYHVEKSNIELINVTQTQCEGGQVVYSLDEKRYIQPSRMKNSRLIGFLWTNDLELVAITDMSVEFYHIEPSRRRLKHMKLFQSSTNWFVYQPHLSPMAPDLSESVLVVSTGSLGNSMQPYLFSRGQILRLQRFEVEGNWHDNDKVELFERSITIANIYGQLRLLVLQHESLNVKSKGAQIIVYTVDLITGLTSRTHSLDLDINGRFAINVLDNLIIAHDQPSKSSFIFDIMIESTEKSDSPKHFVSVFENSPIRGPPVADGKGVVMYSMNWVFFQPNFIIDAKLGHLCVLHLDLASLSRMTQDDMVLLKFLANRKDSELVLLEKCRNIVKKSLLAISSSEQPKSRPLARVSALFDILSQLVVTEPTVEAELDEKLKLHEDRRCGLSLDQQLVHKEVFQQLDTVITQCPKQKQFILSALSEFIFLVRKTGKSVHYCFYEQLLKGLLRDGRYFQVIQMIRSGIIVDSKQLACMLLSMEGQFDSASQLGRDMLNRLGCPSTFDQVQLEA